MVKRSRNSKRNKPTKGQASRVEERDLYLEAIRVHANCELVERFMKPVFDLGPFLLDVEGEGRNLAYAVKHRVKSPTDIIRKVERKRSIADEGSREWFYSPEHITDGCGFRVVTLFQHDMITVMEELLKMIRHQKPYSDNKIDREEPLKEIVIYTNRPKDEEGSIHVRIKQLCDEAGFQAKTKDPENRKSGYSSVHLVINVQMQDESSGPSAQSNLQPMEIQVRDIFEEAWGEVDFSLRYVHDREGAEEDDIFSNWKPHLNALKTFADGCAQHAGLIKKNAIDALKARRTYSKQLPFETSEKVADLVRAALPSDFHLLVEDALATEKRAQESLDFESRRLEFNTAADLFRDLIKKADDKLENETRDSRNIGYHLKMEYAYCLQPKNLEEGNEVVSIYREMQKRFPDDALACYRHGVALLRRGDSPSEAEGLLDEALNRLKFDNTVNAGNWIYTATPRQLALALWQQTQKISAKKGKLAEKKRGLLVRAVEFTQEAINFAEKIDASDADLRKAWNNLVYYEIDYLRHTDRGVPGKITKAILDRHLNRLESMPLDGASAIYTLHTLTVGYQFRNKNQKTKDYAFQAGQLLYEIARGRARDSNLRPDQVREHLDPGLYDIHDDIYDILFG